MTCSPARRFPLRTYAALLLASAAAAAPQTELGEARDHVIDYERLATDLLARHGHSDANPDTFEVGSMLGGSFVHARVGLFEVYISAAGARNETDAASFKRMLEALVALQGAWLEWLDPVADLGTAERDLEVLARWLKGVRGGRIAKAAREHGGGDLFEQLGAKKSVREAGQRAAHAMASGAALGLTAGDEPEPVVLAPTRREFVEFVALAGWLYPDLQGIFWQPQVASWTNFYVDQYKVLALEFAGAGAMSHWGAGIAMDANAEDGMAQQISQLAANSLIDHYFGDRIPPSLAGGLSVNLVIDLFGQCSTRVDGDLRSRRNEAYEVFVPGGNSAGGWLPAIAADSRWRQQQGADHFVGVLRAAQRAGASSARSPRDRVQLFELIADGERHRMTLRGPFLGSSGAENAPPPMDYRGDYKEFLRSYRTCFVHWLRERVRGSTRDSQQSFARLLVTVAGSGSDGLEDAFERVYDSPLSSSELTKKDLEGEFLYWLSRQ